MTPLALALALLAVALLTGAAALVARRRHQHHRRAGEIRVDPLPRGMKQVARHVGAVSSFGMGLRLPPPGHGVARRRPGTLVSVR